MLSMAPPNSSSPAFLVAGDDNTTAPGANREGLNAAYRTFRKREMFLQAPPDTCGKHPGHSNCDCAVGGLAGLDGLVEQIIAADEEYRTAVQGLFGINVSSYIALEVARILIVVELAAGGMTAQFEQSALAERPGRFEHGLMIGNFGKLQTD